MPTQQLKILLMGYRGAGKRTACLRIETIYGLRYQHSSLDFNPAHPARTASKIWDSGISVYSGLRDVREYRVLKARKMFDASIWVDASKRGVTARELITVEPHHAQYALHNNTTKVAFDRSIDELMERLQVKALNPFQW